MNRNNNFQQKPVYQKKDHPPKVTAKGTELPMLDMKGKPYLQVAHRLVWFREDHPDWSIETDILSVTPTSAYAKATIKDAEGRIISTSHKFETASGFPDFIEKAETGAIGRALALIGYGTQFSPDLDEEERIVDSPVQPATEPQPEPQEPPEPEDEPEAQADHSDPANYIVPFGRKYKGRKLGEIPRAEMEGYIKWLDSSELAPGTPMDKQVQYLKAAFERLYSKKPTLVPDEKTEQAAPAEKPKNLAPQTMAEADDLQKKMQEQKMARAILAKQIFEAQQKAKLKNPDVDTLVLHLFNGKKKQDLTTEEMQLLKLKLEEAAEAEAEIA